MRPPDYYSMLGVNRKTSKEEIKTKYRKLAKTSHPDANIDDPKAEDKFKDLNAAYDTLTDKDKKHKYDKLTMRYGYGSVPKELIKVKFGAGNMEELLEMFKNIGKGARDAVKTTADEFMNKLDERKEPKKGDNIEATLDITLEDGLFGVEKKIAVNAMGKTNNYTVNVPKGIKEGEKIRLAALGKPGKNGGKSGDLIITVHIKENKLYTLSGNNLTTTLDISHAQAIIGDKIYLRMFDNQIEVVIKPNTKNEDKIIIQGKGYASSMGRGDLIVSINIEEKEHLTERERKIYEQLLRVEKQIQKEKQSGTR